MKTLRPDIRTLYSAWLSSQGHAACTYIYIYGALQQNSFDDDDSQPVWWR